MSFCLSCSRSGILALLPSKFTNVIHPFVKSHIHNDIGLYICQHSRAICPSFSLAELEASVEEFHSCAQHSRSFADGMESFATLSTRRSFQEIRRACSQIPCLDHVESSQEYRDA